MHFERERLTHQYIDLIFFFGSIRICFGVFAALALMGCATTSVSGPKDVVIKNVSIITPASGALQTNQSIRVRVDRIVEVGPSNTISTTGATVVDGSGKYVVPGLWDMHVHLQAWGFEETFPLLVANGILGVRDMGTDYPDHLNDLNKWVNKGGAPGVRIHLAGQMIDGPTPPDWPLRMTVGNPEEAKAAVRAQAVRDVDFIKVHGQLDRTSYFAIADAARAHKIPFAGHVTSAVTGIEAAKAGQLTIEHLSGTPPCQDAACTNVEETFRAYKQHGTVQVPTLVLMEIEARGLQMTDEERQYVTPTAEQTWEHMEQAVAHLLPPPDVRARTYKSMFQSAQQMVRRMKEAGIPILAGSDFGYFSIVPGISLHKELELLVQSGLTPLEALQAVTSLAAKVMDREQDFGSVEGGKYADFLLLNRNPLTDISALRDIHGVVTAGHLYIGKDRLRLLQE